MFSCLFPNSFSDVLKISTPTIPFIKEEYATKVIFMSYDPANRLIKGSNCLKSISFLA